MQVIHTKAELKNWLKNQRKADQSIGFVPTMGALHEGHVSLMELSVAQCDKTILSVFVNPTQFGPNEDFSRYPRTLEADCKLAELNGVDVVFAPSAEEMYSDFQNPITFAIQGVNQHLCGKSRPGHFEGVLLVVNKLFNIVQPDKAFFGKKDIQQCIIIKNMVSRLDIPIEIVLGETVRESDGLAKSSRNRYLNADQRSIASIIYQTLTATKNELLEQSDVRQTLEKAIGFLKQSKFKIDYIELVNEMDLQPVTELIAGKSYILACAVYLDTTRLIDNLVFTA